MKASKLQQENGSDSTSTPPLFTVDQKHSSTDNKEVKNSVHFSIAKYGIFPQFGLVGCMWSLLYSCSVAWTVCWHTTFSDCCYFQNNHSHHPFIPCQCCDSVTTSSSDSVWLLTEVQNVERCWRAMWKWCVRLTLLTVVGFVRSNKEPMGCDAQLAGQVYKQDDLIN